MVLHNFNDGIAFEKSHQPRANAFYIKQGAKEIIRCDSNSYEDMKKQWSDIDLLIKNRYGKLTPISEKARPNDWNDFFIEFWSKYPNVPGWMNNSKADWLAYFFPTRMFWINKKQLVEFYNNALKPAVPIRYFDEIYNSGKKRIEHEIQINNISWKIYVINSYNKTDLNYWQTIGVSIPFKLLDGHNVFYKECSLQSITTLGSVESNHKPL